MPRVPLHYVDLRTFCYATEDEQRVESALRTFLPEDFEIERSTSTGHHGDRIVVLSARVENADGLDYVLDRLAELETLDEVMAELDQRVDDNCSFFVRLDKQAAFKGDVRLGEGLTLRAKVEAYPAKKEKAVENVREALELARDDGGDSGGADGNDPDADDAVDDADDADDAEAADGEGSDGADA